MSRVTLSTGRQIYYELIEGHSGYPYLIFLHDGLGCTAMWQDYPEQLCKQTQCPGLVYDRSGYGQSSAMDAVRTINYIHDYALNEFPEILQAIIPRKPYILIGHSDGGSISLIHAAERSSLLRGIVSEAAHVFVEPETLEGIRGAVDAFERGKFKGLYAYHGDKTDNVFRAWSETWLSEWFKHWNIEYVLPSIHCPLLVIQGSEDLYGTEHQVQSIASKASGRAEIFFIENCGHVPHLERSELVRERVSAFIDTLRKP